MKLKQAVGTLIVSSLIVSASFAPAFATPSKAELDRRLKHLESIVPSLQGKVESLESRAGAQEDQSRTFKEAISALQTKDRAIDAELASLKRSVRTQAGDLVDLESIVQGRSPLRFYVVSNSNITLNDGNRRVKLDFDLPDIDPRQGALLLYHTLGVDLTTNKMSINGVPVSGGITRSPDRHLDTFGLDNKVDTAKGNVTLIGGRQHGLKNEKNVMLLEAKDKNGRTGGDLDDFTIDNIVVIYHAK